MNHSNIIATDVILKVNGKVHISDMSEIYMKDLKKGKKKFFHVQRVAIVHTKLRDEKISIGMLESSIEMVKTRNSVATAIFQLIAKLTSILISANTEGKRLLSTTVLYANWGI